MRTTPTTPMAIPRRRTAMCVAIFVALGVFLPSIYAQRERGKPELRTWKTKDRKHSIEAVLVEHSVANVTLKLKDDTTKKVRASLLSTRDIRYLEGFPELKKEATKKDLPFVLTRAKIQKRPQIGQNGSENNQLMSVKIDITNRSQERLGLTVFHGFLLEDLTGKQRGERNVKFNPRMTQGFKTKRISLDRQKDTTIVTETILTTKSSAKGKNYKSGERNLIIQVYWKGELVSHWSASSAFDSIARDPKLMEKALGARNK